MKILLPFALAALALALLPARASVAEILAAIQQSDFRFARSESDTPFVQTIWVQAIFHPHTELENGTRFTEKNVSQGVIIPVYVAKRDMIVVGECFELGEIKTTTGISDKQSVLTVGPVAAWLRQCDENDMLVVFVAPFFSRELEHHDSWGTESFGGIVDMHWRNERWAWLYGAVHEYSYGNNFFYPYAGAIWTPTRKCVVNMVFPWPNILYAPRKGFLFSLGITPGGSSYASDIDGVKTTNSLDAWNLTASAGWCFHGKLWLVGGIGVSGLARLNVTNEADERVTKIKSSPLVTLSIQFRP